MTRGIKVAPPLERLVPLFPQVEIDGLVAVNELSAVYRAHQTGLDRRVALKILPEFIAEDEKLIDAFIADARMMAPLQHPNLVRVFDFGESDGLLWVIQEWVEGRTLREILAEEDIGTRRSGELLARLCQGLAYAHEHGAIHGDIRASHIMIDDKEQLKLMNFGLGRIVLAEADINMPGVVAPELLDPDLEVDHRADVFALGVLLYEMLVGERPVGEVEMPSVARPGIVGPEFDVIVAGCLHPDPERRFQDCTALRTALEELVRVPAPSIAPAPAVKAVPRLTCASPPPRRQPVYFPDRQAERPKWPLILGLLLVVVIAGWFVKRHRANIAAIEETQNRKVEEVERKIAENERKMEAAKREMRKPKAVPPEPDDEPADEHLAIAMVADEPGSDPPDDESEDPAFDDAPPPDPIADLDQNDGAQSPAPDELSPAGIEDPPLASELEPLVAKIPELDKLRGNLRKNAQDTVADVSAKLDGLRQEYAQTYAKKQASAAGHEVEFWASQLASLSRWGRPSFELPQVPPEGAESLHDAWQRDFVREAAPLDRFRRIYLEELAKIRHSYSLARDDLAVAALTLERTAAVDANYFLRLCSDRPDQCGVMIPGNVAHVSMGARGSGVINPERINDGIDNMCTGHIRQPIRLELGGMLRLTRIEFVLNSNSINHHFRYFVQVSPDGENWELVCDRSQLGRWDKQQVVEFAPRPVRFIELVGTYNSLENGLFSIRELEAYCATQNQ